MLADQSIGDTGLEGQSQGPVGAAINIGPILPVRDADGNYTFLTPEGLFVNNPVATAELITNQSRTSRILGNLFGEYTFLEGLVGRVSVGADILYNKEDFYAPSTTTRGRTDQGIASIGVAQNIGWLNENTLTYTKKIANRHDLTLLGGVTMQTSRREGVFASSRTFTNDDLRQNDLSSSIQINKPGSNVREWGLFSYLGRVNYGYAGKYLVTLTARADGSSRFGAGNKYGFFPSGSVAWRIIEEPFLQQQKLITDLKLRTSYGITGNQEIPYYQSLSALSPTGYVIGRSLAVGFSPNRVANTGLKWETTNQFDAGIDIGLWQNRISLTVDYYHKKNQDMLLLVQLPYTSGYTDAYRNLGSMENKGLELAVTSSNVRGAFTWTTNANVAFNRNKILDLGGVDQFLAGGVVGLISSTGIIKVGEPIGSFWGYRTDGIYQSTDEITGSAQPTAKPGDIRLVDVDGNKIIKIINDNDRTIVGQAQPKFIGGITNTFSYRNIELSVFFQGSYGNSIFNANRLYTENPAFGTSTALLDRWTPTNPSNTIPRAIIPGPNFILSDRLIEDGSYLRARNITLSYTLLSALSQRMKLRNLKVYLSGQNLLTFTNYSGFDPEVSRFGQNNLAQGIDQGPYPSAKSYIAGLNITF